MSVQTGNIIRYAIYTRQSVEKTDNLGSREVQFITCRDHAQATGEANLHWTGQRFDAGRKRGREKGRRLLPLGVQSRIR